MESQTKTAAESLLSSVKGIARACVAVDAAGRITRVQIVPDGVDDRSAMRNAQSALMAVLGQNIDVNRIGIGDFEVPAQAESLPVDRPSRNVAASDPASADPAVLDLKSGARRSELNEAARVAFDTLRAAQTSFHGFGFDGAELVKIAGQQYVVVAVRRASTDARYCGAAPVQESVATASARALLNAVGVAAMGATHLELHNSDEAYEPLKA